MILTGKPDRYIIVNERGKEVGIINGLIEPMFSTVEKSISVDELVCCANLFQEYAYRKVKGNLDINMSVITRGGGENV